MAIALVCACGAHFEVEDTFAGQGVSCPECHRPLKAPVPGRIPLRTSGYAIASLVLALVLAFSVVGTVLAVLLGVLALVSIARHPDRLTGTGYALCGIVLGLALTGLTLFALSKGELFDQAREKMLGAQVDRSGPMEIIREKDGFAITRPTPNWGIAGPGLVQSVQSSSDVMLADVRKDAYIDVTVQQVGPTSIAQCRENVLESYRNQPQNDLLGNKNDGLSGAGFKLRESHHLPPLGDAAVDELLLDVRVMGQPFTFLVRLIKENRTGRLYIVRGWAFTRRFPKAQAEFRQGLDSFRLLRQAGLFKRVLE